MTSRSRHKLIGLAFHLALAGLGVFSCAAPVLAQGASSSFVDGMRSNPNANMVVKATEMVYNNDANTVTAQGSVQIYYDGRVLQADRVVYDRASGRVRATGNIKITESDGTVTYGDNFDLTDNFRDGFINSLRMVTPDATRFAASRAERTDGNITVFEQGVYTACEPCKEHPEKPPTWQIKAARIIHNDQEKTVYFEDAHFEFLGIPIAYFPYMSAPDPTVKRKSGFLAPEFLGGSHLGFGMDVPYFLALAPNYDLTVSPGFTTKQGPIGKLDWRHRTLTGSYEIRAAGVFQLDPNSFPVGQRDKFRGTVDSQGEFWLNDKWSWGWDSTIVSDRFFRDDYGIDTDRVTEGTSTLYLTGRGDKSWFDARLYYFLGLTSVDVQKQLPIVFPVIDYDYIVDHPVLGGELGWNINLTNLSRQQADFDQIGGFGNPAVICDGKSAASTPRADCIERGIAGDYSRLSANVYWKRQFTDSIGELWTPFAYLRGDVGWSNPDSSTPVQFAGSGNQTMARGLPAIGLEYRYPFVSVSDWGTQTIEPISQIILRPKLAESGQWPNEDAQSLLFDDNNLFAWDKYSGYDRIEDGSRLNAGFQYTLTTNDGGYYNAMFGESYVFGDHNPYAVADMANTGLESGLATDMSDYVARIYAQPFRALSLSTSARFDQNDFSVRQLEVGATGTVGRLTEDVTYGQYAAQPALGLEKREGVQGKSSYKLTENWSALAGGVYDIDDRRFASRYIGLSYLDDCVALALRLSKSYSDTDNKSNTTVMFQLSLRTLGGTGNSKDTTQQPQYLTSSSSSIAQRQP